MNPKLLASTYQWVVEDAKSPVDTVLSLYNLILESSALQETDLVCRCLVVLRQGLHFERQPLLALNLGNLYTYAEQQAQSGDWEEVVRVISELRRQVVASGQL